MGKKIRSAKGEIVDFDLLKVKEQIKNATPSQDVRARQDFIEKRMKRRLRKTTPPAPKVEQPETEATAPKMPATEELSQEPKIIDQAKEAPKRATRQKARPPKKTNNTDEDTNGTPEGDS